MAVLGWKSQLAAAGLALVLSAPAAADQATASPASSHEKAAATGDEAVATQIKQRLNKDRAVRQADIIVEVHTGVATLAGSVPSQFARDEAVDIAARTPGVARVDNELRLLSSSPEAAVPP